MKFRRFRENNEFPSIFLSSFKSKARRNLDIEPHEILIDNLSRQREQEIGVSEKKFEVPLSKTTIFTAYVGFFLIFLFLFGKIFLFQVLEAKEIIALAQDNIEQTYLFQPPRGTIYDSFGEQLVFNDYSFDLLVNKKDLPIDFEQKERLFKIISEIIKKDAEEFKEEVYSTSDNKTIVFKNLSHEMLLAIETKINNGELNGFEISQSTTRRYKDGKTFSHIVGYMGKISREEYKNSAKYSLVDYMGKIGLEKSYENVLRGNPGFLVVQKDAKGEKKSELVSSDPEPGKSLQLWIDGGLQRKLEENLLLALDRTSGQKAVAVAMDPKTGGVVAMVSLPTFDNNAFSSSKDSKLVSDILNNPLQPMFNRVISGKYLTGSTIKPLVALAALEEKIITPEKRINSLGFIEVVNRYDPSVKYVFRDNAVHGWVDMRSAIARSSNVYFYSIGGGYGDQKGLGPTRIKNYLELFGWGQKTNIDIPGEVTGFIPDIEWKKNALKETWLDGDTYYLSIGQQYIGITPLQVVSSFCAIANGGTLYEPRLVKSIVENNGNLLDVKEEIKPTIIRENFIQKENIKVVQEAMRQTVLDGSATGFLKDLPFTTAAKTGTAELGGGRYNTWVTVFAPYEDPQIVLTVMIEDIRTTQATVLPVARDVLNWYFSEK